MGLENPLMVDAIGVDKQDGAIVLNLIDSWDWSNLTEHIAALRNKLEAYLNFALSEQILEYYPEDVERNTRIEVILKHAPPGDAIALLDDVATIAKKHKIKLLWQVLPSST